MKATWHLRISGRVQGVGYRASLRATALANGISGWVRNCRGGTVEAVVQGDPRAVGKILAWAKRGPPMARVTDVSAQAAQGEFDRPYSGFEELPSG